MIRLEIGEAGQIKSDRKRETYRNVWMLIIYMLIFKAEQSRNCKYEGGGGKIYSQMNQQLRLKQAGEEEIRGR